MSLKTPFGEIVVEMNDNICKYQFEILPNEQMGSQGVPIFKVEGRYKITPCVDEPLSFPVRLKCRIDSNLVFEYPSGLETGERYSAVSLYHDKTKLCIGSWDELGEGWPWAVGGGLELWESTKTGIEIQVGEANYWKYAFFCVAWTTLLGEDFNNNGDTDVWFAAEPFLAD